MIMESLKDYLETVAGYVFDDDKLVTYKWLSKELEVHVNIAKQILWEFRQKHKDDKTFNSTFLLMGTLQDGGMRVEVVKEEDLSTSKEKFINVISEHIYSIQKVLPEINVLGLAETGDVKYSAIKCIENNERSDKEIHLLRWGAAAAEMQIQEKVNLTEPMKEKSEKSPQKNSNDSKKNTQKKGFNNLFGKVSNKQKSPSSSTSNVDKTDANTSNNAKQTASKQETSKKPAQKGGLTSFLQQGKTQGKAANATSPETNKNVHNDDAAKEKVDKKVNAESNNKQKKDTRGKKRNRSKEVKATTKKRKRIAVESDSSDNGSSDEEQDVEMEIPPPSPENVSPVRIRSPSPPKVIHKAGKRKVLKSVDKTFEEDGYLVTKKVRVYESCSEEEKEEVAEQKKPAPEPRVESKGKKNIKQTTLTNFFKKS